MYFLVLTDLSCLFLAIIGLQGACWNASRYLAPFVLVTCYSSVCTVGLHRRGVLEST